MRDENAPHGFKGYCIDLIDEIAKIVKFEYEIIEVEDKKFGNMDERVSFSKVIYRNKIGTEQGILSRANGMES